MASAAPRELCRSEGEEGQHDRALLQGDVDRQGLPLRLQRPGGRNDDQVILAASVTEEQNDLSQLHSMIEATRTSLAEAGIEERPEKLLADPGYCSGKNLAALDDEGPDA